MTTNTFKAAALLLAAVAAFAFVWRASAASPAQNSNQGTNQNSAAPPTGQPPQPGPQGPVGPPQGPLAGLSEAIKGREAEPAEKVFKNIRQLKGRPAGQLLRAMGAFTRALGVNCAHCHVPGEWEKDDKPTKDIARGMIRMVGAINSEQLKSIPNLRAEATVSCSTCHRGAPRPDPRLPGSGGPPPGAPGARPQGERPAAPPPPTPSPAATPPPGR
jgi:hypothetical protein